MDSIVDANSDAGSNVDSDGDSDANNINKLKNNEEVKAGIRNLNSIICGIMGVILALMVPLSYFLNKLTVSFS